MAVTDKPARTEVRRVRRTLDDCGVSLAGRRVLAMCSGGADSVALVALVGALPRGAAPRTLDVCFLDHALRADVAAERQAATAVCDSVGATLHERRASLELAHEPGGIEAAAREWRYRQATELAISLGCDVVVTGHTASDQLETALLSMIGVTGRGTGPGAIAVRRDLGNGIDLVRPLLGLSRREIESVCTQFGLEWAEDPSNADADAHVRNAIRHRVVPALVDASPGAGAALTRHAAHAHADSDVKRTLADALVEAWGGSERLDVRRLAPLPVAVRHELVAAWLRQAMPGRGVTARHVAAIDRLALLPARAACASLDLPGNACVRRDGYDLAIELAPRHGGSRP